MCYYPILTHLAIPFSPTAVIHHCQRLQDRYVTVELYNFKYKISLVCVYKQQKQLHLCRMRESLRVLYPLRQICKAHIHTRPIQQEFSGSHKKFTYLRHVFNVVFANCVIVKLAGIACDLAVSECLFSFHSFSSSERELDTTVSFSLCAKILAIYSTKAVGAMG